MNSKQVRPPALASWVLRHLTPVKYREELTGDLLERLSEGRSGMWFWRQCLMASLIGFLSELRAHLSHLCFALAGTALLIPGPWLPAPWRAQWYSPAFWLWMNSSANHLWVSGLGLPWPLSTVYDFGTSATFEALVVAPLLSTLLAHNKAFSWARTLRLFLISILLLASADLASFLAYLPHRGWQYACSISLALLIAAWVGCPSDTNSKEPVDVGPAE